MYKLKNDLATNEPHMVIKDGRLHIPFDPANRDYQEYLEWVAEDNTPEEAE